MDVDVVPKLVEAVDVVVVDVDDVPKLVEAVVVVVEVDAVL